MFSEPLEYPQTPWHVIQAANVDRIVGKYPEDRLWNLKELSVSDIRDIDRFLAFVRRCPKLEKLTCNECRQDLSRVWLHDKMTPYLRTIKAPLTLVRLFVPGRPVEDITIVDRGSCWPQQPSPRVSLEGFSSLTASTARIRSFSTTDLPWQADCIGRIATLFPHLENLAIELKHGDRWNELPEDHLSEIVRLWADIKTLRLTEASIDGPPPMEILERQLAKLEAACSSSTHLEEVSFEATVCWRRDRCGHWTAIYSNRGVRDKTVMSPLDYLGMECEFGHGNETKSSVHWTPTFPHLPSEILLEIGNYVGAERSEGRCYNGKLVPSPDRHREAPIDEPQDALKSLSLANKSLRGISQPLVFDRIHLRGAGGYRRCAFGIRKLLKMFENRPETASWFKIVAISGLEVEDSHPSFAQAALYLIDLTTQFLLHLARIQQLDISNVTVTSDMYGHIYRLADLQMLRLTGCTVIGNWPNHLEHLDVGNLRMRELRISNSRMRRTVTLEEPTETRLMAGEALGRLARGPCLRKIISTTLDADVVAAMRRNHAPSTNVLRLTLGRNQAGGRLANPMQVITSYPNLVSLELHAWTDPAGTSIPKTVVPSLRYFRGTIEQAEVLVPGRPIEALVLHAMWRSPMVPVTNETLQRLASGTVPLKRLEIQQLCWPSDSLASTLHFFPYLEALEVHAVGLEENWLERHLADVAEKLTMLKVVHVVANRKAKVPTGEDELRILLQKAKNIRPTLQEVGFDETTWGWSRGSWTPMAAK